MKKPNTLLASLFLVVLIIPGVMAETEQKAPSVLQPVKNDNIAEQAADGGPFLQPVVLDANLVRESMQARAAYEELNRKVLARKTEIFEQNEKIRELQAKMRELQQKIDKILAEDKELNQLKEKMQSIAPEMPAGLNKPPATLPSLPAPPGEDK